MPIGERAGELNPRVISLDPKAHELWVRFHDSVEAEIGSGGEFEPIRSFANKAPEHSLRLAGVLSLISSLDSECIDTQHMGWGIWLVTYYLNEALRLSGISHTPPEIRLAERLWNWLTDKWPAKSDGPPDLISLPDIYQGGIHAIRTAKKAREIMGVLERHWYVEKLKEPVVINGTTRHEVWRILL